MRCDDSNNVYISKELEKVINVFNKFYSINFRFIVNKFNVLTYSDR